MHRPTYESDRTLIVLEYVPNEDHRYYETVQFETTRRSLPAWHKSRISWLLHEKRCVTVEDFLARLAC